MNPLKTAGSLVIDLLNTTLSPEDKELIIHPLVGGIILFSRNFEDKKQIASLCHSIRSLRPNLIIMVDHEGGRVQRFKEGFTIIPPMGSLGEMYDADPELALLKANQYGKILASELKEVGIHLSLAPVLDLRKYDNSVIGDRAFHRDPFVVTKLASRLIAGLRSSGMGAVGKHFPGHGSVQQDTHTAHPVDERSLDEIERDDMIPFLSMIEENIAALMPSHIIYPSIDDKPVGYSSVWLKNILRERAGFQGVIFSDDLSMRAAGYFDNAVDRFLAAREAGCDFVLMCNDRESVVRVLSSVRVEMHQIHPMICRQLMLDT